MEKLWRLTCDGDAAEAETLFDVEYVLHNIVGLETDRIVDESVFKFFDGANHGGLFSRAHIVMNDTAAAEELFQGYQSS